jgi:DNA processing protein
VESAADIVEELGSLLGRINPVERTRPDEPGHTTFELDPEYENLLEAMGFDPISVDQLIERTGLSAEAVSSMLLLLELNGHVSSALGGYYCRTGKSDSRMVGREEA